MQGLAGVQYSKVDVDWVCADSSWTLTVDPSSGYDNVDGGAMLDFTVTVTVPAGATAGTTCTANVLADEVRFTSTYRFRQKKSDAGERR